MNDSKARKLTIGIFKILLVEQNGYTEEEVNKPGLVEGNEGDELWTLIENYLREN